MMSSLLYAILVVFGMLKPHISVVSMVSYVTATAGLETFGRAG